MPQQHRGNHRPTKGPGKIIAVGGAKGGIGKSLFVANLGVLLAQLGKKTVLVDLDLGASNLHLYMGVWSLPHCLDDFLNKTVPSIDDIIISTKYGPQLIGGGGCKLGDANIHFSRKVKLLHALRELDADYVIIDLGGDTTYNILDFYLAADQGLVLTTCEPASYMDAYGFIKLSLQRKLTRLFGAESVHYKNRDRHLERLIRQYLFSSDTTSGRHISDLLSHLENEYPSQVPFVRKVIDDFRPATVVTMSQTQEQVDELVTRLKKVSRKILSIDLDYFGCLPFESQVQKSAVDLVPYVSKASNGHFSKALRRITLKMEMV